MKTLLIQQKQRRSRAQRIKMNFIPAFVPRFVIELMTEKEKKLLWGSSYQELMFHINNIITSNTQLLAIYDLDDGEKGDWRQPIKKKMLLSFKLI